MRIFSVILFLVLAQISVFGQGNVQFSIAVVGNDNKPIPGLVVSAIETTTLKKIGAKTGSDGKTVLKLEEGKEWAISVGEMAKSVHVVSMPGRTTTTNRLFIYDLKTYKRRKLQNAGRSNATFKVVTLDVKSNSPFKAGECLLRVSLHEPNGKILSGTSVEAVNVRDSIVYKSKTDPNGNAFFILPNKSNYDVDVDGITNFHYIDFTNEYAVHNLNLIYAPTVVNEKIINDTVYQQLDGSARASSSRTLMRIMVSGGKKGGVSERVYLRQLSTGKIFSALTDDQAVATFLVPSKHVYMVDFNYQKDADAINLLYVTEILNGQMSVQYNPDPRLEYPETFIPTPDRLLLKGFNDFLTKQFERPKNKPFLLSFKSVKKIHAQSKEALFMLTLAGSELNGSIRLPLNAAFVLDKSGSMYSDNRAEALKRSLVNIADALNEKDLVSVILFDDQAVEVQQTTSKHKENLQLIADNYSPGGGTNIYRGLERGAESIKKRFDPNRANKIILMTDGYGDNPPKDITDFVEAKFGEGIEFSAIGLGADYNQSMLELIALKGNGTFSYVDESLLLSDAFLKEVKGSLNYSAKDLVVEVFYNEKLIFSNLHGYPVKNRTGNNISFEIGKVPQGANRIAFLKFKLDKPSVEIQKTPLIVKVSYYDFLTNKKVAYTEEVKLTWTQETETEILLDQQEKELYSIAILNQSMKGMAEAYERADSKEAQNALKSGKEQIEELFPKVKPKEVKLLFDEVDRYLELFRQIEKNAN